MLEINDRGMIKWQPFDSVTSTKKMCMDILQRKDYQRFPLLSEDQIKDIEELILESYYNKDIIFITYYHDGKCLTKEGKIKYLDKYKKQLILSDTSIIHFKQIINIKSK